METIGINHSANSMNIVGRLSKGRLRQMAVEEGQAIFLLIGAARS